MPGATVRREGRPVVPVRKNGSLLFFAALALAGSSWLPAVAQVLTSNCPQDDTCFTPLIGSNRKIYVNPGTYTFNNQVVINNVQDLEIECAKGTVITVPPGGLAATSLFLISGSNNVTVEGCEMAGLVYSTGKISVTTGSASATLTNAPSATAQTAMANGWLSVPGTTPSPDGSATHAWGATISTVSGTAVTLTSTWPGSSCASCPFQIAYGLQNAIQVVDEQCAINTSGISGSGTTVTVTTAASSNCNLSNGQFVTVFGTGTIAGGSYNNINRGPITILSSPPNCAGVGQCQFSYPDTTHPGSGSTGTISLKSQHIFVRKNHVHHLTQAGITAATLNPLPSDATSDLTFEQNYVHDCGTSCVSASRASHVSFNNNTVFNPTAAGVSGACYNLQQAVAPRVIGNQCAPNNAAAEGIHGVYLYGGTIGAANDIHDTVASNTTSASINVHCDTCFGTAIVGNTVGEAGALPGSTQPGSGSTGIRVEVGKAVAVTGNSIYNVGGPGVFFNSRLENTGSGYNAATQSTATASCVNAGASGCTTPSGHQLWSADDQSTHTGVQFTNGNGVSVTFNVGAITLASGTACTSSTTPACVTDTAPADKLEGAASQKICPNNNCTTAAAFSGGTIFYVNIPCNAGANCLGSGSINVLTVPIWRIGIISPTSVPIQAGDFQLCLSSQPNLVAPESCTDIPQIVSNSMQYIELIPANWEQVFDNPGVQSFGLVARSGGTSGSYKNIWGDDFAVDVAGRMASIVVSGNTIYRPQGAGIATSGGSSRFAITGNTIIDPGWDTSGSTIGGAFGIYVENALTSSTQLIKGPPLIGGTIEGNNITSTLSTTTASATCIKLNVLNSGSIDQVRVGTTNSCLALDWAKVFDPTTATNYGPQFAGGVGILGSSPTCTSTGIGGTGSCAVAAGSTDTTGTVALTAQSGAAAAGVVTLTFSASSYLNSPSCQWTLGNVSGSGSWASTATAINGTNTTSTGVVNWATTAALTSGSTYDLSYACMGH